MKKRTIVSIIVGCVLLLTAGVTACKHGYHDGGFDAFDLAALTARIAFRLDLSDSQKAQLEQIGAEIMEKAKTMHADRAAHLQQLADLVRQDTIDKDVVDMRIDEKIARMREMADFVIPRLIAFHTTLTPEQREKIADHIAERASGGCRFGFH